MTPTVGDFLAAIVFFNTGTAHSGPSGWSLLQQAAADGIEANLYGKVATISDTGPFVWNFIQTTQAVVVYAEFSGVTGVDGTSLAGFLNSLTVTGPSVLTSQNNDLLLTLYLVSGSANFPVGSLMFTSQLGSGAVILSVQSSVGPTGDQSVSCLAPVDGIGGQMALFGPNPQLVVNMVSST